MQMSEITDLIQMSRIYNIKLRIKEVNLHEF